MLGPDAYPRLRGGMHPTLLPPVTIGCVAPKWVQPIYRIVGIGAAPGYSERRSTLASKLVSRRRRSTSESSDLLNSVR